MYLFSPYIFQVYKAVVNAGCTSPYSFSILRPKYSLKTMRFLLIAVIYSTYSTFCELDRFSDSLDCVFCGLIISVIGNWIGSNGIFWQGRIQWQFFLYIHFNSFYVSGWSLLFVMVSDVTNRKKWRSADTDIQSQDPRIRIRIFIFLRNMSINYWFFMN